MLKNMFKKTYTLIDTKYNEIREGTKKDDNKKEPNIPEGLWRKCNKLQTADFCRGVKEKIYLMPQIRR